MGGLDNLDMKTLLLREWREQRWILLVITGLMILIHAVLKMVYGTEIEHIYFELHNYSSLILAFLLGLFSFNRKFINSVRECFPGHYRDATRMFLLRYFSGLIILLIPVSVSYFIIKLIFGMQINADSTYGVLISPLYIIVLLYTFVYFCVLYTSIIMLAYFSAHMNKLKIFTIILMPLFILLVCCL